MWTRDINSKHLIFLGIISLLCGLYKIDLRFNRHYNQVKIYG